MQHERMPTHSARMEGRSWKGERIGAATVDDSDKRGKDGAGRKYYDCWEGWGGRWNSAGGERGGGGWDLMKTECRAASRQEDRAGDTACEGGQVQRVRRRDRAALST